MPTTRSLAIPSHIQAWADSPEGKAAIEKWLKMPAADIFKRRLEKWQASGGRPERAPLQFEVLAWEKFSPDGIAYRARHGDYS